MAEVAYLQSRSVRRVAAAAWGLALSTYVHGAPTLVENVHGYTLAGNHLQQFGGIVFNDGKVLKTGDEADLRRKFPQAEIIDGRGQTLLPGMIDAHGHVLDLGFIDVRIKLYDVPSLRRCALPALPGTHRIRWEGASSAMRSAIRVAFWSITR